MKKYLILALVVLVIGALATGALAIGKSTPAGKSNVGHLFLVEKDPVSWEVIWDGSFGKLKYNLKGSAFKYLFNAHGLDLDTEYCLIYYADDWPGNNPGALIASGTSNGFGDLHLRGSIELDMDLPDPADANYPEGGAKIWLVPESDYNKDTYSMTAWNPTDYLFEYDLITYHDTDIP